MLNPRIVAVMYAEDGSMYDEVHSLNCDYDLSERDMKRWFNHICKELPKNKKHQFFVADVFALYTDAVGDTHDLSDLWMLNEQSHNPYEPRR